MHGPERSLEWMEKCPAVESHKTIIDSGSDEETLPPGQPEYLVHQHLAFPENDLFATQQRPVSVQLHCIASSATVSNKQRTDGRTDRAIPWNNGQPAASSLSTSPNVDIAPPSILWRIVPSRRRPFSLAKQNRTTDPCLLAYLPLISLRGMPHQYLGTLTGFNSTTGITGSEFLKQSLRIPRSSPRGTWSRDWEEERTDRFLGNCVWPGTNWQLSE